MNIKWLNFLKNRKNDTQVSKKNLLFNLPGFGLIKISGHDALKFLQGQLTCDVAAIQQQVGSLCAHCNPQGRIISLFYIFVFQGSFYLLLPKEMVAITLLGLKKYAIFSKVELEEVSEQLIIIGSAAAELPEIEKEIAIIQVTPTRCIMIGEVEGLQKTWNELAINAKLSTSIEWQRYNIIDKIPAIYPETSGLFLPHELNLKNLQAISFTKGCFTGQEIIARMEYKGKLKKMLYAGKVSHLYPPAPGTEIFYTKHNQQQKAGMVVDSSHEHGNIHHVLFVLDKTFAATPLFIDGETTIFDLSESST